MSDGRDVNGSDFSTHSQIHTGRMTAQLVGCLDGETTPQLRTFLQSISDDMVAGIIREVSFEIGSLLLISSSSISCFAVWVKHTKDTFPDLRIAFRTNQGRAWQARALAPIRKLAEQMVSID